MTELRSAPDRAQQGAALLAEMGVVRVPLPIPFLEAGGPVNVYVIEEQDGGLALFDAGIGTREGEAALLAGFRALGRSLSEVRRIFISHGHVDHYGFARAAQDASGAAVFCHVRDHDKVSWRERTPERSDQFQSYLQRLGVSQSVRDLARLSYDELGEMARPIERLEPLPGGERLQFARFSAEVMHLPGHTPGLVCLWAEEQGVLFSDDHLLEAVSPNPLIDLEGQAAPTHRALVEYLRSAVRVRALPARLIAPGHGPLFGEHTKLIDRLLYFYGKRQARILELLQAGPQSAAALAVQVFPRAKEHQQYLVLSEVVANLEVLEEQGRVVRTERAGSWLFGAV